MDLIEAIYQRRAVQDYSGAQVAHETIETLLNATVQAPSSLNQQPWAFAIYQGKTRLQDYSHRAKEHFLLTELPPFGLHKRGNTLTDPKFNIFYNASTLVVICAKPGYNAAEDCSLAAQTFMLAAHGMSLGTSPIGIARPWLQQSATKVELKIPPDYTPIFPLTLGYPAGVTSATPRNAPEIISWLPSTDS